MSNTLKPIGLRSVPFLLFLQAKSRAVQCSGHRTPALRAVSGREQCQLKAKQVHNPHEKPVHQQRVWPRRNPLSSACYQLGLALPQYLRRCQHPRGSHQVTYVYAKPSWERKHPSSGSDGGSPIKENSVAGSKPTAAAQPGLARGSCFPSIAYKYRAAHTSKQLVLPATVGPKIRPCFPMHATLPGALTPQNPAQPPSHLHIMTLVACHSKSQLQIPRKNTMFQPTVKCLVFTSCKGHGHSCSCSASFSVTPVAFCSTCHPQHRTAWLQPGICVCSNPRLAPHPAPCQPCPQVTQFAAPPHGLSKTLNSNSCATPSASLCCKEPVSRPKHLGFRRTPACLQHPGHRHHCHRGTSWARLQTGTSHMQANHIAHPLQLTALNLAKYKCCFSWPECAAQEHSLPRKPELHASNHTDAGGSCVPPSHSDVGWG